MDEYVDVFSDKWTKRLKIFAYARLALKIFYGITVCIVLVILTIGLAPYIKGTEIWEDMPFTLSQLEAILSLLLMCYLCTKSMKVF